MLHQSALQPATFSLLKKLMKIDALAEFDLAGGTALALRLGHRISYDLDFFGNVDMSINDILDALRDEYQYEEMHRTEHIVVLNINNIKVDFVIYTYPLLHEPVSIDGVRLLAIEDITAMKLDAIKGRGARRDFYDLYFLLKTYELSTLLDLHQEKYGQDNRFLILKSLVYFGDAEDDAPVNLIDSHVTWEEIKESIIYTVNKI